MANYYGVQRSKDYLAHYGIKGMKWGVRKAKESGNERRLDKQYQKAQKKLQKLNLKADRDIQQELAKKHTKRAIAAGSVGLAGASAVGGVTLVDKLARKALQTASGGSGSNKFRTREKKVVSEGKGIHIKKPATIPENEQFVYPEGLWVDVNGTPHYGSIGMNNAANPTSSIPSNVYAYKHPGLQAVQENRVVTDSKNAITPPDTNYLKTIQNIGKGLAIGGLGTAAYQTGRAIAAKRRTTDKGHAKAVAKRDAFQKEMNAAFKGTKYDHTRKKKRR